MGSLTRHLEICVLKTVQTTFDLDTFYDPLKKKQHVFDINKVCPSLTAVSFFSVPAMNL